VTELPRDRIRVDCIRSGGILTLLILSTCHSGQRTTAGVFWKEGSPYSDLRAIMVKQVFILTEEITSSL
jgi:hypothetical protein